MLYMGRKVKIGRGTTGCGAPRQIRDLMDMKHEYHGEQTIEEDWWGYPVVPGIEMDLPEGFKVGDKVQVTIIIEKSV